MPGRRGFLHTRNANSKEKKSIILRQCLCPYLVRIERAAIKGRLIDDVEDLGGRDGRVNVAVVD